MGHEQSEARARIDAALENLAKQATPETLTGALFGRSAVVEITITVRASIVGRSNSHGTCYELELERRDFAHPDRGVSDDYSRTVFHDPRRVWVDADEIVEVQP